MVAPTLSPRQLEEVCDAVLGAERVLARGAGTKPPLSRVGEGMHTLSTTGLRGILEYEPAEFTVTALAGTPVVEVESALAEHGQFLPFDPPFAARGATLGGAVAAGISGSGRQRYGGVRDFLIGVTLVDGEGRAIRGGGKVVKNAAGFDLPKLMVGSLGTLGVLVELTFKVFPRPLGYTTLRFELESFAEAHERVLALMSSPLELDALDLALDGERGVDHRGEGWCLWVRLGGAEPSLAERARRVEARVGGTGERLRGEHEAERWAAVREATWAPADRWLARIPVAATAAPRLEADLQVLENDGRVERRYSCGCGVLWIAWPPTRGLDPLQRLLARHRLVAQLVAGGSPSALVGEPNGLELYRRVKAALDPRRRFPDLVDLIHRPTDQAA